MIVSNHRTHSKCTPANWQALPTVVSYADEVNIKFKCPYCLSSLEFVFPFLPATSPAATFSKAQPLHRNNYSTDTLATILDQLTNATIDKKSGAVLFEKLEFLPSVAKYNCPHGPHTILLIYSFFNYNFSFKPEESALYLHAIVTFEIDSINNTV
jgi:hypothetical protein